MRVYWEVARRAFQQSTTYRGATLAGIFTNTVFGFIYAFILRAVYLNRTDGLIDGFSMSDTITFVFVAQGLLMVTGGFRPGLIPERIQSGDVVVDLYRPIDFQLYWLAHDIGRAAFHAIFRGIPPILIGSLVFDFSLPGNPLRWVGFLISVVLAAGIAASYRFLADMAAFWIFDVRGVIQMFVLVQQFFQGSIIPLHFLPAGFESIVRLLPFAQMIQHPVEMLLGRGWGAFPIRILALQLGWLTVTMALARATTWAATRRVVVQGG